LGTVIKAFVAGLFSAIIVLLIRAALIGLELIDKPLIQVNSVDAAYSHYFSYLLTYFQHPAYFSMSLNFAVILLIIFKNEIKLHNLIRIPLSLFFVIIIYLLSSRAGILACSISIAYLLYIRLIENKPGKFFRFLFSSAVVLVFILIVLLNPRISVTIKETKDKLFKNESVELKDLEPRTRVWYSSIQLIKEYPIFGVGVKELDQKLVMEYRRNNFYEEAFFTLNAHNQFLETQLTFGISGTILLIWMLFAPLLRKGSILNITLYISFLILIIVHFLFESMLVRQWGIMFFVLFSCLQVFIQEKPNRNKVEIK
jgi:O-antigen ligase